MFIGVTFDDFMTRHFGKLPIWFVVIELAAGLVFFVKLAWEKAGKVCGTPTHITEVNESANDQAHL